MAKISTRPKATTSKKTETAGSAAPDGAADIRMIPLNQLEPSPLNVRKVAASASDEAELLASIRETGIKQTGFDASDQAASKKTLQVGQVRAATENLFLRSKVRAR